MSQFIEERARNTCLAPLPAAIPSQGVKKLHESDLRAGSGKVALPYALERKYPNAEREWGWQFVFPAPAFNKGGRGVRSPMDVL